MTSVNVGQCVRNAVVHATAWWTRVADEAPADLNIALCLRNSQLLRNVVTWFCANDLARRTALAFYGSDGRVDLTRLPCMMALMYVACQVTGLPNWTHAALEASDMDQNVCLIARQARDDANGKARVHKYMSGRLTELASEVLHAMRGLQDRRDFEGTEYFGSVSVRETDLLKSLRQLTAVATRLLVVERSESEAGVRSTLQRFVESCAAQPETATIADPAAAEPLAAKLAEQVADKMTSVEKRLGAVEQRASAAHATANGAEQIAEAAERAAAAAAKAGAHKPPRAPSTKLVSRVDGLAQRLESLETGVSKDVGDLMKAVVKVDHKMDCLHDIIVNERVAALEEAMTARVAALEEALTARVAVLETALTARVAAVEETAATRVAAAEEAAAARVAVLETALTARLGELAEAAHKARTSDVDSRLDYLTSQAQAQFWSQWHALQMQWTVMCRPREGADPAPAPGTPAQCSCLTTA